MKSILFFILISFGLYSTAQDYHHWSEHFGARASLMGGAATSGLGDNAVVYYNPAAMAFVEDPSMSISVNAYRFRMLTIPDAMGEGLDLKETSFTSMPNLIAGVIAFDKHPKLRVGYAILTRRVFNSKFDFLHEYDDEILSQYDSTERIVLAHNSHHSLMEYWAGFGISYQLTDHFSIGFSHFGAYRNVKYGSSYGVSILPKDYSGTEVYQYNNRQSIEYFNVKGLIKPSISLTLDKFRFGLAATLPSFNMFGKAKAYREISIINIADVDPSLDVDVQVVDRVEGLDAVHKENGSIAFGVSWRLGKRAWLHFTNETFFGGKRYYIFKADEMPSVYPDVFTQQELEDLLLDGENFLALSEETEARTNIGIGLEAPMGKRLGLYLGARTNFLYKQIEPEYREVMKIESSKWSLVDFSGGLVYLTKKNKRYTAGIEYATAPFNLLNYAVKVPTHSFKLLLEIEVGKPQTQDSKTS